MAFKLAIKNFGPIKATSLSFKRVNVLIGPQSSGKSTILKIASFCNWLEKQIQLSQDPMKWVSQQSIKDQLLSFHRLEGYAVAGSEIAFKSETISICIRFLERSRIETDFHWCDHKRWTYKRTKNTYIPAERNIVAAIPNWIDINFDRFNNLRNYMAEWGTARKFFDQSHKLEIQEMGVSYFYDQSEEIDKVVQNGKTIKFSNASSGLQSFIPQYTLLSYLFDNALYNEPASLRKLETIAHIKRVIEQDPSLNRADVLDHYQWNNGVKVFLEEPEQNLFPRTQYGLIKWLARKLNGNKLNELFVSTHSPYILSSLNNLIQAHESSQIGNASKSIVKKIMKQADFVNFEDVSVYGIDKGRAKTLLDKENRLISQSFLDSASIDISNEFSRLLDV